MLLGFVTINILFPLVSHVLTVLELVNHLDVNNNKVSIMVIIKVECTRNEQP